MRLLTAVPGLCADGSSSCQIVDCKLTMNMVVVVLLEFLTIGTN